jgi:hypothetical protein
MNRIRSITIATVVVLSVMAVPVIALGAAQDLHATGVPPVDPQLKLLTEKLELTADQQDKLKPILQEMHDTTLRLVQDESMSRDERMGGIRAARYAADKKIRVVLSDDQKSKLDQLEAEPHPELHGQVNAPAPQK